MEERRQIHRSRMLRGGKILLHRRASVINCTVRNLSPEGACLQVSTVVGIPFEFDLAIDGEDEVRPCHVVWESETRIGVSFKHATSDVDNTALEPNVKPDPTLAPPVTAAPAAVPGDVMRGEVLRLRAALDH